MDNTPPVIWVVEDDAVVQRRVSDHLKANHFKPIIFNTAEKAYEALNAHRPPALIILNVLLPSMSGVDLVRLMKQNKAWEKIPIVVTSVLSRKDSFGADAEKKPAFWTNKPIDTGDLIKTVQNVLMSVEENPD